MFHGIEKQNIIEYIQKDYITIFVVPLQCGKKKINTHYFT